MSNKKRNWYPETVMHITARGNRRNDIFRDLEDFQVYAAFMVEAMEHFQEKFKILSYCLMDNHVHILVKTEDMHIGNLISRIHSIYTRFFNNKYNYLGHLFQDRYYTELVEDDAQLLSTSRYIHLNPVKANMVENPQDYEWSSYSMYIGLKEEKIIESERILSYFKRENARESYRCFVESAMKKNEIEKGECSIGIGS